MYQLSPGRRGRARRPIRTKALIAAGHHRGKLSSLCDRISLLSCTSSSFPPTLSTRVTLSRTLASFVSRVFGSTSFGSSPIDLSDCILPRRAANTAILLPYRRAIVVPFLSVKGGDCFRARMHDRVCIIDEALSRARALSFPSRCPVQMAVVIFYGRTPGLFFGAFSVSFSVALIRRLYVPCARCVFAREINRAHARAGKNRGTHTHTHRFTFSALQMKRRTVVVVGGKTIFPAFTVVLCAKPASGRTDGRARRARTRARCNGAWTL